MIVLSKYNETSQNNSPGGVLTYTYRWKITNWSEVRPFMEHTSPSFNADGLVETTPGCLQGIRKKVSIIFVLENLRTRGMDFGKKHSTWGEENLMSLDEMDSNDTVSLCVKFEIQESIIDALPEIVNPFNKLVNSQKFSDITFRVTDDYGRDKLFYAHKGILASSSPVFEAMLTNGMRETFEDEIHLSQTNHSAFLSLLTFIYTFKVNNMSLGSAENLLALADKFAIIPVREECLRYFRLEMNTDNVWGIWAIAEKFSCAKTSTACRDFVALNLDTLLDKHSTLCADPNILCLALENDEANVTSEEKIYELVVRWANHSFINDSSSRLSTGKNSSKNIKVDTSKSIKVDTLSSTSPSSSSASMLSELPKGAGDSSQLVESKGSFPKPWKGDRLAALPSLLKCVRFPVMQKRYIVEKVEGNATVMAAEIMKDLIIEAYRFHLMPDVSIHPTNRTKLRKKKTKITD
ncbi:2421_t:CDS:2 [Cetraspora pellucida]|uniref:2421_t:CDS:1 n=1 Tax=Cetraspora pellucida TaxID=1433469 RepID=A0A9N9IF43_9GLOM|nr:2421_t:CDS:2 [Cetraspora pellucida]